MHVDGALQHNRAFANGHVHQLRPRKRPAGLPHQTLQQPELRRRQIQFLAVHGGAVADAVDPHAQVIDDVRRFGAGLGAAL